MSSGNDFTDAISAQIHNYDTATWCAKDRTNRDDCECPAPQDTGSATSATSATSASSAGSQGDTLHREIGLPENIYEDDSGQFMLDVATEARKLRVRETARQLIDRENAPPAIPFDAGTLDDILARPAEPPYRVQNLVPSDAGTLLVAQRKTGKTTWALNLARSLVTGEDFLGRFGVLPITGRVAVLNFEVSGATFATWAHEAGIPSDRIYVVNLRGHRNPFTHSDDRAALADLLKAQDVEALFVDPFGRAYDGATQNDAGEVGGWLSRLDEFTRAEVGARDLILAAHAGWNGERTRGSSALEDWADVVVNLTSSQEDDDPTRYMRAIGRDVDFDEDQLHFDHSTRALSLTGTGSRKAGRDARAQAAAESDIAKYVEANPGCSGNDIQQNVDGRDSVVINARRQLVAAGKLIEEDRKGRGGGKNYRTPEPLPSSAKVRPAEVTTSAPSAYRAGVVKQMFDTEPLPTKTDTEPAEPEALPRPCCVCSEPIGDLREANGLTTCANHYQEELS